MKELRYFYCPDLSNGVHATLPQEEAEHIQRVLRLNTGDSVVLTDGCGHVAQATISEIGKKQCTCQIQAIHDEARHWKGSIHIAVAPTKNIDRIEWLAEKATEIGCDAIHLIECRFSERKHINKERLERIVLSAMKQSHKSFLPEITALHSFRQLVDSPFNGQRYIAHCYNDSDISLAKKYLPSLLEGAPCQDCLVAIGPEGDFSIDEIEYAICHGFQPVSLGDSRLRTETAALFSVMLMNLNHSQDSQKRPL
ncbi:MAG: 16S rRNA (uracil(1498)-N(3))-methyltransferase [Prevotellaceae bacterium]|nr:16S rRNA (uracil(1498)-N(3))-methyltransferase [Prevotellaceae bacterium]